MQNGMIGLGRMGASMVTRLPAGTARMATEAAALDTKASGAMNAGDEAALDQLRDRDRFVLSVGHASALLYALLHLCGVRQTSRPPQGPLGQGVATIVGMAIAQASLAAACNRPGFTLFNHRVCALAGDGDMMEGLSAMRGFGLSAPGKVVRAHFGFDVDHVLAAARQQLALHAAKT